MLFRTCTHLRNFDFTEYTYSVVAIRLVIVKELDSLKLLLKNLTV